MVSCGASHTLVLTEVECVWTCGDGRYGKLGHGNDKLLLTLKFVSILEGSRPVRMSMVASDCHDSVDLTSGGQVFTWGLAKFGSLGVTESSVVCIIYGESEIFTEDRPDRFRMKLWFADNNLQIPDTSCSYRVDRWGGCNMMMMTRSIAILQQNYMMQTCVLGRRFYCTNFH